MSLQPFPYSPALLYKSLMMQQFLNNKINILNLMFKVRKLETDLVQLRDKAKAEEADKNGDVEKKATGGESARKILECQMKDYCKYKLLQNA